MESPDYLKDQLDYFIQNQDALVQRHNGKVLVIKDRAVVGVHDSDWEAYVWATSRYALGTFLIQRCAPGEHAYTLQFASRHVQYQ